MSEMDSGMHVLKGLDTFKKVDPEQGRRIARFISKANADGSREFEESYGVIIPVMNMPANLAEYPSISGCLADALIGLQNQYLRTLVVKGCRVFNDADLGVDALEDYCESIRPVTAEDVAALFKNEQYVAPLITAILEKNPTWNNDRIQQAINVYKDLATNACTVSGYKYPSALSEAQAKKAVEIMALPAKYAAKINACTVVAADEFAL